MITDVGEVLTSDMGNFVLAEIENHDITIANPVHKDFTKFINGYKQASAILTKRGNQVFSMAGDAGNLAKVRMVSGTQLHSMVLNIGHFFGASFKPWQAVRIASNIKYDPVINSV